MASFAALNPYHDHYAIRQVTDCDDPFFGVVEAVINPIQSPPLENESGVFECERGLFEGGVSPGWVERYFHTDYCIPKKHEE